MIAIIRVEYWNIGMVGILFFPLFHYSKVPFNRQLASDRFKDILGTFRIYFGEERV